MCRGFWSPSAGYRAPLLWGFWSPSAGYRAPLFLEAGFPALGALSQRGSLKDSSLLSGGVSLES